MSLICCVGWSQWAEAGAVTSPWSYYVFSLRFPREVIAVVVRWYLRYGLSYRDVGELLPERGVTVITSRSISGCSGSRPSSSRRPEFIEAARLRRNGPGGPWLVGET
jgi:transposase-like protein